MFSKEQIQESNFGKFMEVYNRLFRMSPEVFLAMLYTGRITAFKWIYLEMKNGDRAGAEGSWLQEQVESLDLVKGPKDQAKLVKEVLNEDIDYKHSKRVIERAERREAKAGGKK